MCALLYRERPRARKRERVHTSEWMAQQRVRVPVSDLLPRSDVSIREKLPQLEASIFGRESAPLRTRGSYLGLYCTVVQKGVVSTGDDVELID